MELLRGWFAWRIGTIIAMPGTHVYEIDWSGTGSNVLCAAEVLFFLLICCWFLRIIARNLRSLRRESNARAVWSSAGLLLFSLLSLIALAAIGGAAAQSGGAGSGALGAGTEGVVQGYSSSVKPGERALLASSLLGLPLIVALLISTVLFEGPLRLSVSPTQIELLYRFPWRNRAIRDTSITEIELHRHNYFEHGITHQHFYTLIISHDSVITRIHCNQRPWYEEQLQAAYGQLQRETRSMVIETDD